MDIKNASKALMKKDADVEDLKYVLSVIREDPRLAQRYVTTLAELMEDNEHKFSTIELEMFATMKLLFDAQVKDMLQFGGDKDYLEDYVRLGSLVKSMYETLNKALQNARIKERREDGKLGGYSKMEIPLDGDTEVSIKKKKVSVIDV